MTAGCRFSFRPTAATLMSGRNKIAYKEQTDYKNRAGKKETVAYRVIGHFIKQKLAI